jgi:hypothetical protein
MVIYFLLLILDGLQIVKMSVVYAADWLQTKSSKFGKKKITTPLRLELRIVGRIRSGSQRLLKLARLDVQSWVMCHKSVYAP